MPQFTCHKHDIALQLICDEYVCGLCYEETILTEKLTAKDGDIEFRNMPRHDGHRGFEVKSFRHGKEIEAPYPNR